MLWSSVHHTLSHMFSKYNTNFVEVNLLMEYWKTLIHKALKTRIQFSGIKHISIIFPNTLQYYYLWELLSIPSSCYPPVLFFLEIRKQIHVQMSPWGLTNFWENEKGKKKLSIYLKGIGWQILYLLVQYTIVLILELPSRYLVLIEPWKKLKLHSFVITNYFLCPGFLPAPYI